MFSWKRPSELLRLTLNYGTEVLGDDLNRSSTTSSSTTAFTHSSSPLAYISTEAAAEEEDQVGFKIELDWNAGDDEDQVALGLQSQLMVALPAPQDCVRVDLKAAEEDEEGRVEVGMKVEKKREELRGLILGKSGSGQQSDGVGVLTRLFRSDDSRHWKSVTLLSLGGCGLATLPAEIIHLPNLEKLYLENNRLSVLPPELGELKSLKILTVDYNMLVTVPLELGQCVELVELSLEHNKLVRPLLDFRSMAELQILRLFGNPLEFLPEMLPLHKLRHLSLANMKIEADESLRSVNVQIEMENSSYFGASRHKLSAFFSLIFCFSSCHHPLLASVLAKIMQDQGNRVVGKDLNAVKQLISMMSSDNCHVVKQACSALSALAGDVSVAMQLMKWDILQPIETVLKSVAQEEVISVLQVVATLSFSSDTEFNTGFNFNQVQRLSLLAVGNLAFCLENRQLLVTSGSLQDLLLHLTASSEPCVKKAAARALAILGENENLRRSIRGRPVAKQGLRILSMDGGGMKSLATVQILKAIEKGTGKRIHEIFDLICGTSTGGMLAVALGMKLMTLDQCEEIYKNLGKLVFAEPVPKDNEAATWREKLDQLYKSSSQSFRVVVHGYKHSADHFESLLKEICADEDGELLIDSAVKKVPKVFVVSTLVSVMPAQPFVFHNYQKVQEFMCLDHLLLEVNLAFIGSCKHHVWQAIRASSAAPYYLDDFSDDVNSWQDGALVANNPTIFAIREAQLLWPDTRIDCLVSIGCGSIPTKVRKGGWRYLDTGQVLIESACSVDRVEEALSTLLPMLPEIQYFRFNPVDDRCGMELDETDPAIWLKLKAAVDDYVQNNSEAFKNVCERLTFPYQHDDKLSEIMKSQQFSKAKVSNADETSASLGWRRNVLLVEALHSPDSGRAVQHSRALETFCSRNAIRLSLMHATSGIARTVPPGTFPSPFSSPLITGSFPSSPLLFSPDLGSQRIGHIDSVPP
ncbi:hypothetical protein POTOM_040331 [Populus tomentosa]|uniref:PNPLA domain-containing protein n=1 Tax=Populus tomentosa TaxID=118781 RepID=A0A8X7YNW4_POPTO|nr:hypothetical protein POTOM_040331 [Populus tomentosa]